MGKRRSKWLAVTRTPTGACAAVLLVLVIALAIFAPIIWGARASVIDTDSISQGPSAGHLFGTDDLGRDILYRVLVASRLSLELAVLATLIGVGAGTILGALPSILPRRAGRFVTSAVNIAVAFPGLLLALFFAVIFGVGRRGRCSPSAWRRRRPSPGWCRPCPRRSRAATSCPPPGSPAWAGCG